MFSKRQRTKEQEKQRVTIPKLTCFTRLVSEIIDLINSNNIATDIDFLESSNFGFLASAIGARRCEQKDK